VTSLQRYTGADFTGGLAASSSYGYDFIGRLTSLTHTPAVGSALSYTWDLDADSRIVSMSIPGESSKTFSYDNNDQLTSDAGTNYSYDDNENRTNSGYQTAIDNRLSSDGNNTYTYDDEGNRVFREDNVFTDDFSYTYDHHKRLTVVERVDASDGRSGDGSQQIHAYDNRNRLTAITYKDGSGATAWRISSWRMWVAGNSSVSAISRSVSRCAAAPRPLPTPPRKIPGWCTSFFDGARRLCWILLAPTPPSATASTSLPESLPAKSPRK